MCILQTLSKVPEHFLSHWDTTFNNGDMSQIHQKEWKLYSGSLHA